jgi:hypothetical protein
MNADFQNRVLTFHHVEYPQGSKAVQSAIGYIFRQLEVVK